MKTSTRVVEIAFGCAAALLPLVELHRISDQAAGFAIALSAVAVAGVTGGALRSWSPARGVAAMAIVANGFAFSNAAVSSNSVEWSSVVLWLDAVLLLMFLLCGGLVEAGVHEFTTSAIRMHSTRLAVGILTLAALVALQQIDVNAGTWLVIAAMAAGIGALVLARRNSN
jgi:hypothetical protein